MNKEYLFEKLAEHIGHNIEIVGYYDEEGDLVNISLECNDCNEVILDTDEED